MPRVELGYKHAGVNEVVLGTRAFAPPSTDCILDADGDAKRPFGDGQPAARLRRRQWRQRLSSARASVWPGSSIDTDFSGTFPTIPVTGFGVDDDDSALAWQLIAGIRMPVSDNIDAGVKYRFFNTRKLKFSDGDTTSLKGHWRSHSLLASLTYNFYSPPPPPPPPPPAAASAASGDADVPGRLGDPGDRGLPGSAASASAAAAGARARLSDQAQEKGRSGETRAGFFYAVKIDATARATGAGRRSVGLERYRAAATGLT